MKKLIIILITSFFLIASTNFAWSSDYWRAFDSESVGSENVPDLTGEWIYLNKSCNETKKGTRCKVKSKFNIKNIGDGHAGSSLVRFYLSDDNILDGGDTFLKQVATGKILSGQSKIKSFTYNFDYGITIHDKYVFAFIDAENTVTEIDEANNIISISFDTTSPSNVSLIINCGAESAPSTTVILSISATDNAGVTGYYAAEDPTTPSATAPSWISVSSAISYSASVPFTLSAGDGTKTIYVWIKDAAGNVSEPATDSTILSTETITGQIIYHPPTSERKYSYYHYIPESALMRDPVRILLYAHGSGEINTYPEMEEFIRNQEIYRILPHCDTYGYVLTVMVTPRNFSHVWPDYMMNTQNMVRWVMFDNDFDKPEYEFYKRPDLEFVKVIDDVMSFLCHNGYMAYNKVFMTGFSAGGVQSQRFSVVHPGKVAATAVGGAPGFLYPIDTWDNTPLHYHVGIYDIGQIPYHTHSMADFMNIPHFIFVGGDDTNDALYHPDMYDDDQSDIIKTYFGANLQTRAQMFSDYLSLIGMHSTVKIYPGIGHVYTQDMLTDTFTFFDAVPTD
ncbi:MAG: CARDB domain-containing protein [Thermodesulfovibrionales bacterium]|nr:CARDB domain-containing protein [Thermodesulfovibrionales bacterium]